MVTRRSFIRRWKHFVLIALAAIVIITGVAILNYQHLERQAARLPSDIRRDLTFSPLIVTLDNEAFKATDYNLFTAEDKTQHLSFYVYFDDERVTVTQSAQPPQFSEIPEFKQRFLDNAIQQYATVQTVNGTIYLGKQVKRDNRQLGIMLERGLVVIFNPETELSQAQWRRLGEQFDIQRISN